MVHIHRHASFSYTTILYGSAQQRISKYIVSFYTDIQNNSRTPSTTVLMDIEVDMPRGRLFVASPNNSRESSTHSNILSMAYADRVQALANSLT